MSDHREYTPRQRELLQYFADCYRCRNPEGENDPWQWLTTPNAKMTWEEGQWLADEVGVIVDMYLATVQ